MYTIRILLVGLFLSAACSALAQRMTNMGFQLQAFLAQDHPPGTEVDLFLRGDQGQVARAVHAHAGVVKQRSLGLVAARVPVVQVAKLLGDPAVQGVEFSLSKGRPLNDSMRVHNRVDQVHAGLQPLQTGYTGQGVLMGIIDSGLDVEHPDFKDAQGRTRVLRFWDQRLAFDPLLTPQPWGYGRAWDSTAIDAGLLPVGDQPQFFGHGTTVTGTAAGNGLATGTHQGVAPDADLLIVSSDFDRPNWRASVADAVQYILMVADSLDRPVVINASLGDYLGSHDGRDAAALLIDSMLMAEPGRVMVCAAGNSGQFPPYHVESVVGSDTTFTWYRYKSTPNAFGYGVVYFDLWADTAEFSQVRYAVGADRVTPSLQFRGRTPFHGFPDHLGQIGSDSLWSSGGNLLGVVDYFAEVRGAQVHLEVHMQQPDSNGYRFRFMTTGSGRFDGWGSSVFGLSDMLHAGLPTPAQYPDMARYVMPDNKKQTVDSWACSDQVLTVANYFNEVAYTDVNGDPQSVAGTEGDIVPRSSQGPTRDGRTKPDLAATGDITFSAGPLDRLASLLTTEPFKLAPGGMHMRNGGTSMASPVVAGAAALYLEKCSRASHAEVRQALIGSAHQDSWTGPVPNDRWGAGKLDAFAALIGSGPDLSLSVFGDLVLCPGDSVLVSGPAFMESYLWSSGDTVKVFYHDQPGPLSLFVVDGSGCQGRTDTLEFVQAAPPPSPVITQVGNLLESSPALTYQWFFQGTPIGGADEQTYEVGFSGEYHVEVTDTNGCTASSDTLMVIITAIDGSLEGRIAIWPSPTSGPLQVELPGGAARGARWTVRDALGRVVRSGWIARGAGTMRWTIDLTGEPTGSYVLDVQQDDGSGWKERFILH